MASTYIHDDDSDLEEGATALNDDIDNESLIDEQSPTDGYFEQRDIPQQTFVENPATQPPKAKEAAEQSRAQHTQPQHSSQRPQRSRWADEATPLLDVEAPPDYEAATAGQRQQQQQAFNSEHPLVRNGLLSDRSSVNSRTEPQSMRDPESVRPAAIRSGTSATDERDYAPVEAQATERTHLIGGPARDTKGAKGKRRRSPSRVKTCLLALVVVLLIICAIVMTVIYRTRNASGDAGGDADKSDPYRKQPKGPTPAHPSQRSSNCEFNSFSLTESFEFSAPDGTFEFMERMDYRGNVQFLPHGVDISGNLQISSADEEQENGGPDIKVWVNIATFAPLTIPTLLYSQRDNFFEVYFPDVEDNGWQADHRACFDVAVAIHVRKGVRLNVWKTSSAHLNVNTDKHLFADETNDGLVIKHDSLIHTVAGHVNAKYWNSRRTVIETTSGRIEGSFALRDELRLSSNSGTIQADVDPKSADETNPLPAEFVMESATGPLPAVFSASGVADIPDRDYRTTVNSMTGRVEGSYFLGKETEFTTNSANIEIGVLPLSTRAKSLSLRTKTDSGKTIVDVLEPYHADSWGDEYGKHHKGVIDSLKSHHSSLSGAIEAKYPQNWEGNFRANSIMGKLSFHGKDVKIDYMSEIPGIAEVAGHKGHEESSEIKFQTGSGKIDATIGDVERRNDQGSEKDCLGWYWDGIHVPQGWWGPRSRFC